MDAEEKQSNQLPQPTGSDHKLYTVQLTEREMQCLANGITAFFNVMRREKVQISPEQILSIQSSMQKFKAAVNGQAAQIVLVQ